MKFYIKQEKWEDFKGNYKNYGYEIDYRGDYRKYVGNRRVIFVYKFNREVTDLKIDNTTYCGYMYEGEYRHRVKTYIKDLIDDGYVEVRRE